MKRFDEQGILLGCYLIQSIVDTAAWIGTELAAASSAVATAAGTVGIEGTAATVLGDAVVGAGTGAAFGTVESAITGQPLAQGAESGAIGGAITGGGGPLLEAVGVPASAAFGAAGAAGGAAGSAATGQNPATGALVGAGTGALAGAVQSLAPPTGTAPGGGTTSAAGTAAPPSIPAGGPDVTNLDSLGAPIGPAGPQGTGTGQLASVDSSNLAPAASSLAPNAGGATVPGTQGQGAASGASSLTNGITAPPSGTTPDTNLIGATGPNDPAVSLPVAPPPVSSGDPPIAAPPAGTAASLTPNTGGLEASLLGNLSNLSGIAPDTSGGFSWADAAKWAPIGVSALGLGADFIMGNQHPPGYGALAGEAASLRTQGQQLESYAQTGTLPPGMNQALQTAAQNVATQIRATYDRAGQSGSSAEAQDIANLQLRVQQQGETMALNLLQTGVNETQLSSQLYEQLMETAIQQDQMLAQGIGNFATALASMGRVVAQPSG